MGHDIALLANYYAVKDRPDSLPFLASLLTTGEADSYLPGKISSLTLSVLMSSVLTNYVTVHRYRFWSKYVQWPNELE